MENILRQSYAYIRKKAGNGPITDEIRSEASEYGPQGEGLRVLYRSLARDPASPGDYYVSADGEGPCLLRCAATGGESLPFGPGDRGLIRRFAANIDLPFLPRPQRGLPPGTLRRQPVPGRMAGKTVVWIADGPPIVIWR